MPNQTDVLFASQGLMVVRVVAVRYMNGHKLWVKFSDGTSGERDFSELTLRHGPMVAPLHDARFFAQAFVENGALTWPNGYDLDSLNLQNKMRASGELAHAAAE